MTEIPKEKTPDQEGFSNAQMITRPESPMQIEELIARAIEKKVPVDTMEKLLALFEKVKATQAKEEFDRSLAGFQSEIPVIEKSKKVDFTSKRTGNKTSYAYAPLDVIVKQVQPYLKTWGFSYTITSKFEGEFIIAICKITHQLGHSEFSEFKVPIDKESYMNAQQQFASAMTFAKRYAFCNAFGILTGDEDNDAVDASAPKQDQQTANKPATAARGAEIMQGEVVQEDRMLSKAQGDLIVKLMTKKKIPRTQAFSFSNGVKKTVEKMTSKEASLVIKQLLGPKQEARA